MASGNRFSFQFASGFDSRECHVSYMANESDELNDFWK